MIDVYAILLPKLRAVARSQGYALGLHGSGECDLDLIAVPWVDYAFEEEKLVEALRSAVGGFIVNEPDAQVGDYTKRSPMPKPHGRRAWSIYLYAPNGRLYIDLSVMPRSTKQWDD